MYKMQLSVSVTAVVSFVCLLTMSCAKAAELIKMPLDVEFVCSREPCIKSGPDLPIGKSTSSVHTWHAQTCLWSISCKASSVLLSQHAAEFCY